MTAVAVALSLAGAVVWWQIGPDWREHISGIALDLLMRRTT